MTTQNTEKHYIPTSDASATSGANKVVRANASGKISGTYVSGGTGADGALTVSSGTTTIDLGGVAIFTKNYTTISITGTGKVTFSNPHANGTVIMLKATGDVTLTSSTVPCIEASGFGAASETSGNGIIVSTKVPVLGYGFDSNGYSFRGVVIPSQGTGIQKLTSIMNVPNIWCGAGGGITKALQSNGGVANSGGTGGRGGAALYIETAGALNFTGTIYSKGLDGTNSGTLSDFNTRSTVGGQGGDSVTGGGIPGTNYNVSWGSVTVSAGGGGGGTVLIKAASITSQSGTITVTGGTASTGTQGVASGNGANGLSNIELI